MQTPIAFYDRFQESGYPLIAGAGQTPVFHSCSDAARYLAERGMEIRHAHAASYPLCALLLWEKSKHIYVFHRALARLLAQQAEPQMSGTAFPAQLFDTLPDPCIYLHAPNALADGIDGFYAWIGGGQDSKLLHLLFLFSDGACSQHICFRLDADLTWQQAVQSHNSIIEDLLFSGSFSDAARYFLLDRGGFRLPPADALQMLAFRAAQLLMYILSENADTVDTPESTTAEGSLAPVKATLHAVGNTIGAALEKASAEPAQARKAHTRRGHWHNYWSGPKSEPEKRKLILKWISPVFVAGSRNAAAPEVKVTVVTK